MTLKTVSIQSTIFYRQVNMCCYFLISALFFRRSRWMTRSHGNVMAFVFTTTPRNLWVDLWLRLCARYIWPSLEWPDRMTWHYRMMGLPRLSCALHRHVAFTWHIHVSHNLIAEAITNLHVHNLYLTNDTHKEKLGISKTNSIYMNTCMMTHTVQKVENLSVISLFYKQ